MRKSTLRQRTVESGQKAASCAPPTPLARARAICLPSMPRRASVPRELLHEHFAELLLHLHQCRRGGGGSAGGCGGDARLSRPRVRCHPLRAPPQQREEAVVPHGQDAAPRAAVKAPMSAVAPWVEMRGKVGRGGRIGDPVAKVETAGRIRLRVKRRALRARAAAVARGQILAAKVVLRPRLAPDEQGARVGRHGVVRIKQRARECL
eukprot:6205758-Pleurochrysis_carterae.AAC.2